MAKKAKLAKVATGPLKGVRIVDLTSVVFGAYATQMLGDLGADVIKVEFPGGRRGAGGDIMRWAGGTPDGAPDDLGPIYMTINRNKRSILLGPARRAGRQGDGAADQDRRRLHHIDPLRGDEAAGHRLRRGQGDQARTSSMCMARAMAPAGPTRASQPMTTWCSPRPVSPTC